MEIIIFLTLKGYKALMGPYLLGGGVLYKIKVIYIYHTILYQYNINVTSP